jgi:hypothetical protein
MAFIGYAQSQIIYKYLGARNPKGINRIATYNYISVWTLILGV